MFKDTLLEQHLKTSATIESKSFVTAEWNMNTPGNIALVGNYRYRPAEQYTITNPLDRTRFAALINSFDMSDQGKFYTGATDADIIIDGGVKDDNTPETFRSKNQKEVLLYSLEECFGKFRPRSGINKLRYFDDKYSHHANPSMAQRPRYYMSHRDDKFKYWTSFRTEGIDYNNYTIDVNGKAVYQDVNVERGIASKVVNGKYFIDDAAPFVVYNNPVPANRIVVKMQTNVGAVDLGPFSDSSGASFNDPFFGDSNRTVPERWSIQYLENDIWNTAVEFNEFSVRDNDGTPVVGEDGYVEIAYGLLVPEKYKLVFTNAGELRSMALLPTSPIAGAAYLVRESETAIGEYYIWYNNQYETFIPSYGWYLVNEDLNSNTPFVTDLTAPVKYYNPTNAKGEYKEFQYIKGIRVVVETMVKQDSTFDLIELSPRLAVDLTDKTTSFSITKPASDLGISGMPVGQLLAATGNITIFDYDQAFSSVNPNSIIANYIAQNTQIKFYEVIAGVPDDENGRVYDYYVPLKTMYSEGFPQIDGSNRSVSLSLRDLYFYLESMTAPQLLLTNVTLSSAVSTLLDYIGFSNYSFKRISRDDESTLIPFFFVQPDTTVAQVLEQLAISTQSAMFFDEYNNFIVMSKEYMMPTSEERATDFVLRGSKDFYDAGVLENAKTADTSELANIINVSSQENKVFNDGTINYTARYIKKSYGSLKQAVVLLRDRTWVYEPAQLWEISPEQNIRTIQDQTAEQSDYVLSAIPLNSDLSSSIPSVSGGQIINNTVDFGEGIYWLSRHNGYFYANGEIIRFDAVQYSVPGLTGESNVWITNTKEYQNYFSKLPFRGKIYPTGLVRIYAEPNYEAVGNSTRIVSIAKHGRGQFGTPILSHKAGLDPYWSNVANVRGCKMQSSVLLAEEKPELISYKIAKKAQDSSGVVTITTVENHTLKVDDTVLIEDLDDTLNGQFTVLSIGTKTFTYASGNTTAITEVAVTEGSAALYDFDIKAAGVSNDTAGRTLRNGIIKNFISSNYISESDVGRMYSTQSGTVQSSAFVFSGGVFSSLETPTDYISYVYKPLGSSENLGNKYNHFGTRMRIVGKSETDLVRSQTPTGVSSYYTVTGSTPDKNLSIGGASGGLAVMVNPETNIGYYFEIAALTETGADIDDKVSPVHDVIFYKVKGYGGKAIPEKLWSDFIGINVDSGSLVGQYRFATDKNPTVYDLSVEYEDIGAMRRFYLYINNSLVQIVDDVSPLPAYNNMALFVRGSAKCMFENVYALTAKYSQNTGSNIDLASNKIFGSTEINVNDSFRKYAMSGVIQSSYLSGISASQPPEYDMYFEEFGTIMREAAFLKIRYDKAFPALAARISPTFNRLKGYVTSGFMAGSYGAEFLIFNATDTALTLDSSSANALRIQGITFTQQSDHELSVDQYFSKSSDLSNPTIYDGVVVNSPVVEAKKYQDIKNSRLVYGKNAFSLDAPYIQTQDSANDMMGWMIKKIMNPRLSVGAKIFSNPMLQLGDIVEIDYKNEDSNQQLAKEGSRFIIYNIEYSRSLDGPDMTLYLSEVVN